MNETITPEWVRRRAPLVHLITNYVTANDCANLLLAAGASPIMADDPLEAAEITSGCSSLVLNLGTLNPRHAEAMLLAGKEANRLGHPVLLDPVGIGASAFRADTAAGLLKQLRFSVIRGNLSEICRLAGIPARAHGVDVSAEAAQTDFCSLLAAVKRFSLSCGAVIIATGPTDLVVSGRQAAHLRNGHPMMSQITGSGCMLSALLGAYLGAAPDSPFEASVAAVSAMGLCGQLAAESRGTASFRMGLIDQMSLLSDAVWNGGKEIEFF